MPVKPPLAIVRFAQAFGLRVIARLNSLNEWPFGHVHPQNSVNRP